MRGLGTSHNVPISPVRAEEKVARISSHLIHFPADIFSSLQRTPGGETGARGSSHRIVVSVPAFDDESHHLSRVSGQGRGKGRKKFFTPYSLSRGYFLQPSEEHREAKPVPEVLHIGFSLVSGYGRRKGRKKFFTPYLFSRGYFLPSSEEHREAKPVQEVLHAGFSLVSDYGRGKGRKKFFTPYLYSRRYFLQP